MFRLSITDLQQSNYGKYIIEIEINTCIHIFNVEGNLHFDTCILHLYDLNFIRKSIYFMTKHLLLRNIGVSTAVTFDLPID